MGTWTLANVVATFARRPSVHSAIAVLFLVAILLWQELSIDGILEVVRRQTSRCVDRAPVMADTRDALLICGILSPILYAGADVLAGLSWDAYSFRDWTISELGAVGAPTRELFSALLVPVYLLLAAFGIGVWRSARGLRAIRITGALLIGFALLALAVGQFVPMRPRGTAQGTAGALHLAEGLVAMALILAAMYCAASGLDRVFRRYTVVTIVIVVCFGAWSGTFADRVEAGLATPWLGVIERIFWYAYQLWFAVLAVRLLQKADRSGAAG